MKRASISVALGLVARSLAQDWGTTGAWELMRPQNIGPSFAYWHPTSVAGSLVVISNNSVTGGINAMAFDVAQGSWSTWPDIQRPLGDPTLFTIGGQVVMVDELAMNTVAWIDSDNSPTNNWNYPTITGGPAVQRIGTKFIEWGSTIYGFSGLDVTPSGVGSGTMHNDLWALDASQMVTTGAAAWQLATSDNTVGMPPGRIAFSFTTFGTVAVMYGGVSIDNNVNNLDIGICFSAATAAPCHFHQSIWVRGV